jgi:hypothetical protein
MEMYCRASTAFGPNTEKEEIVHQRQKKSTQNYKQAGTSLLPPILLPGIVRFHLLLSNLSARKQSEFIGEREREKEIASAAAVPRQQRWL